MFIFCIIGLLLWFIWMFFKQYVEGTRELGRFNPESLDLALQLEKNFLSVLEYVGKRAGRKTTMSYQAAKAERKVAKKLRDAGLESAVDQGRFYLIRTVSLLGGPLIGVTGYLFLPTYYATLMTLACTGAGFAAPILWLSTKARNRIEDIQRELPLLLDLLNLGTSAGWDVAAALERVVDALYPEFPNHPLFREFKRAKWLAASGYTWSEALERVAKELGNDSVRRSTVALTQAMKQGGDRSEQIEGIAEDAQRIYYSSLDARLATLPVKGIFITMILLLSYFVMLLAPAAVQVKQALF